MKIKTISKGIVIVILGLILTFIVCILTVKAQNPKTMTAELINTQEWDVKDISNINVKYTSDKVYILPTDGDKVILKEYCSSNHSDYYAVTSSEYGTLSIQKGNRPSEAFSFYAEIYIPSDCIDILSVDTTSGAITAQPSNNLKVGDIKFISDSGYIDVSNFDAKTVTAYSRSGVVEIDNIFAVVNLETYSGKITVTNSECNGSLKSDSGKISFQTTDITGNLDIYSKSGKIIAELPKDGSYTLSAKTNSGIVHNYFGEPFIFEVKKKHLVGSYGENPVYSITLTTKSSSIDVN